MMPGQLLLVALTRGFRPLWRLLLLLVRGRGLVLRRRRLEVGGERVHGQRRTWLLLPSAAAWCRRGRVIRQRTRGGVLIRRMCRLVRLVRLLRSAYRLCCMLRVAGRGGALGGSYRMPTARLRLALLFALPLAARRLALLVRMRVRVGCVRCGSSVGALMLRGACRRCVMQGRTTPWSSAGGAGMAAGAASARLASRFGWAHTSRVAIKLRGPQHSAVVPRLCMTVHGYYLTPVMASALGCCAARCPKNFLNLRVRLR